MGIEGPVVILRRILTGKSLTQLVIEVLVVILRLIVTGKTLTPKLMVAVEAAFIERFGEHAGWAHNTLFISDLASQQHRLPAQLRSHPSKSAKAVPSSDAKASQGSDANAAQSSDAKASEEGSTSDAGGSKIEAGPSTSAGDSDDLSSNQFPNVTPQRPMSIWQQPEKEGADQLSDRVKRRRRTSRSRQECAVSEVPLQDDSGAAGLKSLGSKKRSAHRTSASSRASAASVRDLPVARHQPAAAAQAMVGIVSTAIQAARQKSQSKEQVVLAKHVRSSCLSKAGNIRDSYRSVKTWRPEGKQAEKPQQMDDIV